MTTPNAQLPCPHCGYNLVGLTEPRCPECGGDVLLSSPSAESSLAVLALRLMAVWFLTTAVFDLGAILTQALLSGLMFGRVSALGYALTLIGMLAVPFVLRLGLAWVLWSRARQIAKRINPSLPLPTKLSASHDTLLAVAIQAAGFVVLVLGAAELSSDLSEGFSPAHADAEWTVWSSVASLVKIAAGLWMILGGRGIANAVGRLRHAGVKAK